MKSLDDCKVHYKDVDKVMAVLDDVGVALVEGLVTPEILEELNKEYERCLGTEINNRFLVDYSNGAAAQLFCENLKELKMRKTEDFFKSFELKKIVETYFSKKHHLFNYEFFLTRDVVGTEHESQGLHFDVKPTLKFFLYLNDVEQKNGAFCFVPGSHKITRKSRRQGDDSKKFWESSRIKDEELNRAKISVTGKSGTLFLMHTDTYHCTGTVDEGERRVIRAHSRLKKGVFFRIRKRLRSFGQKPLKAFS